MRAQGIEAQFYECRRGAGLIVMLGLAAAATLAVSAAQADTGEYRHLTQAEISAALRECGLYDVNVSEDDDALANFVMIDDLEVSDAQLECAFYAADRTGYVLAWSEIVSPGYYELAASLMKPRVVAAAQSYFSGRPELGDLPERAAGESDLDFARKLERFCGLDENIVTEVFGDSLSLSPTMDPDADYEKLTLDLGCVMNAAVLLDLKIGFIGNGQDAGEGD